MSAPFALSVPMGELDPRKSIAEQTPKHAPSKSNGDPWLGG
jgi:hypothetical protein